MRRYARTQQSAGCEDALTCCLCMQNVKTVGLRFRLVDARGQVVGRLAAQLATILQVCVVDSHCVTVVMLDQGSRPPVVAGQRQAHLFAP